MEPIFRTCPTTHSAVARLWTARKGPPSVTGYRAENEQIDPQHAQRVTSTSNRRLSLSLFATTILLTFLIHILCITLPATAESPPFDTFILHGDEGKFVLATKAHNQFFFTLPKKQIL